MFNDRVNKTPMALDIVAVKLSSMELSNASIARKIGCTREYVRLVLKDSGLPTKQPKKFNLCLTCGKVLSGQGKTGLCTKCYKESSDIILVCNWCGLSYTLKKSVVKTRFRRHRHNFCSRGCLGKYCGEYYGFGKTRKKKGGEKDAG